MKSLCTQHIPTRNRHGSPYCDACGVWLSSGRDEVPETERSPHPLKAPGEYANIAAPLRSDYAGANTKAEADDEMLLPTGTPGFFGVNLLTGERFGSW